MKKRNTISISTFCKNYDIPQSFLDNLMHYELVILNSDDETVYILEEQVETIERFIRLHYDLNINFEGLDVINNLMSKIQELQHRINQLENINK